MSKLRILFTIPNFDTAGSGKVVYNLAKNLDKEKFEVEIACCHNKGAFFKVVEETGIKIHIFDTTTAYRPYFTLLSRLRPIARFFKKNKYDIIHSWHWRSDWTEPLAAKIAGKAWVYTKKAMSWDNPRTWTLRSKLASFITILNPDMKDRYFKNYKNVALLPLGIDITYYAVQEKKYQAPKISYSPDDFVVVSVVNLTIIKGLEVLIDAIRKLNDRSIKVMIVGDYDSEYGRQAYNKVIEEKLTDNIVFIGKVVDVRQYLAVADLFVIPTNFDWEGMPVAPLEAMSCGRMVVGTDTSGINFILKDFPEYLVPPNDISALAGKILHVKNMSEHERKNIATQMRNLIEEKYSMQQFINNYETLYTELSKA